MLFSEFFVSGNANYETIKSKYGDDVLSWFVNRFANFELMYESNAFQRLFESTRFECHIELLKLKKFFAVSEMWAIGSTVESTATNSTNATSDANQSYSGFNVEGDFQKTNSTGKTDSNTTANTTSINNTEEFNKLLSFDYTKIMDAIFSKFVQLFIIMV